MSKNNESNSPELNRSWFQGLKGEFGKITWPNRHDVGKQSIVVLIIALVLGVLIAGIDYGWELVMKLIVG